MKSLNGLLWFVLLLVFVLGASIPAAAQEPLTYEEFVQQLPEWMSQNSVPGMAIALIHEGELVDMLAFGVRERGESQPVTVDTLFQAGSLAKPLTGWALIAYFAEQGIPLDTPIGQLVSLWPAAEDTSDASLLQQLTLEQLLTHYSGLVGIGYPGFAPDGPLPSLEDSLTGDLPGYEPVRLSAVPGEEYQYTGANYAVLQYVVEELTGQSFAAFMDEYLLDPLNMDSVLFPQQEVDAAVGHGFYGAKMPQYRYPEQAASGLYTSAAALVPFLLEHFAEEPLIAEEWLQYVVSPVSDDAFHTPLYSRQVLPEGTEFLAASGVNRGFRSYLALIPANESAILVLTNSDRGHFLIQDIFPAWIGVVADELITASPVAAIWVWFFTFMVSLITVAAAAVHLRRLPQRLPARTMPVFIAMMIWPLGLSVGWLWFWHTDWLIRTVQGHAHYIPAQFMPRNFWVLSLAVVLFCLVQAGFTVARQVRGEVVTDA